MKLLYLVRHAKSSWAEPGLADIDRPINKRGKRDASKMGMRLKDRGVALDLILTSPAKRARRTTTELVKAMGYEGEMQVVEAIYGGGAAGIVGLAQTTKESVDSLMVVGHNPNLTELANTLTGFKSDNVPTCAVICSEHNSWSDVGVRQGRLQFYDHPKLG